MLLFLLACATTSEKNPCNANTSEEGTVDAAINGVPWSSSAQWNLAGSGMQITSADNGGYRLTLVALLDTDGRSAEDALAALPATFPLSGDGGSATLTPDGGDSASTSKGAGGSLSLTEQQSGGLLGCFSFDAGTSSGESIRVEEGSFWATELSL